MPCQSGPPSIDTARRARPGNVIAARPTHLLEDPLDGPGEQDPIPGPKFFQRAPGQVEQIRLKIMRPRAFIVRPHLAPFLESMTPNVRSSGDVTEDLCSCDTAPERMSHNSIMPWYTWVFDGVGAAVATSAVGWLLSNIKRKPALNNQLGSHGDLPAEDHGRPEVTGGATERSLEALPGTVGPSAGIRKPGRLAARHTGNERSFLSVHCLRAHTGADNTATSDRQARPN